MNLVARIENLFGGITLNFGLLILRVGFGGFMLVAHGWNKLMTFSERMDSFPDPLGVGSPVSLALAVGAEVVCSALVVAGAFTRLACIPLIVTMLVAALLIHADDPWEKKELAILYLVPFVALFFTGAGALSIDRILMRRR
jgi:putative oxidoreductase